MKTIVNTEALRKTLSRIGIATMGGTNMLPILSSVKIDAAWNTMVFSVTNLDLYIQDKIGATVKKEGSTVVSYRLLNAFINRATSKEVRLSLADNKLTVAHGENEGIFETLPPEEFPPPQEVKAEPSTCDAKDLVEPLKKVAHAISEEISGLAFQGVNIHQNAKGSEFVATDRHRLAFCKSDMPFNSPDIILPKIAVEAFTKLIEDGPVEIKCDGRFISITNHKLEIGSRLIEATFPKYENIIPKSSKKAFSAMREELIQAVQTASIFLNRYEVSVRLAGKKKELEVSCSNKFKTKLVGTELDGQPEIEKRFNYSYILDTLKVCEQDSVRLELPDGNPVVIREGKWLEVINPLVEQAAAKKQEKGPF